MDFPYGRGGGGGQQWNSGGGESYTYSYPTATSTRVPPAAAAAMQQHNYQGNSMNYLASAASAGSAAASAGGGHLEEENASLRLRIDDLEEAKRVLEGRLAAAEGGEEGGGVRSGSTRKRPAQPPPVLPVQRRSDERPVLCEACGGPVEKSSLDDDEDEDDDDEAAGSTDMSKHFAANPNPQILPHGLVDGRSNSSAAFEQRAELLRQYKAKHGTADVGMTVDKPLSIWLDKQRVWYKQYKRGEVPEEKRQLVAERIEVLERIGVTWERDTGPTWEEMFEKLEGFKRERGHCCVQAIPVGEVDARFRNWTLRQRQYLGAFATFDEGQEDMPQWAKAAFSVLTPERKEKLKSLDCYWLNADNDNAASDDDEGGNDKSKDSNDNANVSRDKSTGSSKRRKRKSKSPSPVKSTYFYTWMEKFRRHMAEGGTPFVDSSSPFADWMRRQRRMYNQIQSGERTETEEDAFQIRTLTDLGFVFDHVKVEKEYHRRRKETAEKELRAKEEEPKRRLETMRKEADAAKARVEELRRAEYEAKERAAAAKLEMQRARRMEVEARQKLAAEEQRNPAGKLVEVASRGGQRKSGRAKIIRLNKTMCVGEELTFYDLEYLACGTIERAVDGLFVTRLEQAPAPSSSRMAQSTNPSLPVAAGTRRRSRGRTKK